MNDVINAGFEFLAGFMVLNHCRVLLKDKSVAGLSILSVVFFTIWGFWNLYYYPSLGQVWSFYGGILIVIANTFWVALLIKYRRRETAL